jgi:hypothetical protein
MEVWKCGGFCEGLRTMNPIDYRLSTIDHRLFPSQTSRPPHFQTPIPNLVPRSWHLVPISGPPVPQKLQPPIGSHAKQPMI